jgi:hypothetical protein
MGILMLRCPTTGRGFAAGVNTDETTFKRLLPRPEIKFKISIGVHLNAAERLTAKSQPKKIATAVINASLDSNFSCFSMGREFCSDLLALCQSGKLSLAPIPGTLVIGATHPAVISLLAGARPAISGFARN